MDAVVDAAEKIHMARADVLNVDGYLFSHQLVISIAVEEAQNLGTAVEMTHRDILIRASTSFSCDAHR